MVVLTEVRFGDLSSIGEMSFIFKKKWEGE